jgi:3-oxoadipate enol-lactonase
MVALAYRQDGPDGAPPLVLGSSLGLTTWLWEPQLPGLAARFRVVRYDHPGHGDSPPPDGPVTLEALGAGVVALLDRLGIGRCHYAGVSIGGMVGMWLAANAPDRVDRLAVCCCSPHLPPPELWTDRAAAVRAGGMAAVSQAVAARWFTPAFRARHPETVAETVAVLERADPEAYAACCELLAAMDLRPALGKISAPTLVIAGAEDPAAPPDAHARVIADAVAGARLEVLPDAAHLANLEQPAAVTNLLLDHFDEGTWR